MDTPTFDTPLAESLFQTSRYYLIDWSKVKTIEDMTTILSSLRISIAEDHAQFNLLKPFLKEDPQ